MDIAFKLFKDWYRKRGWKYFAFQEEVFKTYFEGFSGLLNAPTGSGKTYSVGLPILIEAILNKKNNKFKKGLKAIWISPIRALAPEIEYYLSRANEELDAGLIITNRTGDTSAKEKAKQKKSAPDILITTPESLHILIAQKEYSKYFESIETIVVDEWHELLSSKRGVLMELALTRLKGIQPNLRIWGISATIGNLEQATSVLFGYPPPLYKVIKSSIIKKTEVVTILPDEIDNLPWAGHMGISLLDKVIPIIEKAQSTLVFTNTRNQAEVWYQAILKAYPQWAGVIALHHGSLSSEIRNWVEENLHKGKLKIVVCTSSLDLGVDFRPVETVIQIGSPKGVARFAQRAGRSGHQPGAISKIYLLPTNSLELIEAACFKQAIREQLFESRLPVIRAFDVLAQYLVTLAVGEGFYPELIYSEVKSSYCFESITRDEFNQILQFITTGGSSLSAYSEFSKVNIVDGLYIVTDRSVAMRHRMSIGTITSESSVTVTYMSGKRIGSIEEYFISRLKPGDVFTFSGKQLELVTFRGMEAIVKNSSKKTGVVPSWQGGRMPLSAEVSELFRNKLDTFLEGDITEPELEKVSPLLLLQNERSTVPSSSELLIEKFDSKQGHHLFFYPFEGRLVHEGMAMLFGYRLSIEKRYSFSIAMNDYGFELLSDEHINFNESSFKKIFETDNLSSDLFASTNYSEIARRRFRDIASISGLMFKGFPGKAQKTRHLQANSSLFFDVFNDYDKDNLLLKQAMEEALYNQLEEIRMRKALLRMQKQKLVVNELEKPSPFSFPILVDRLREKFSTESLEDRVQKMIKQMKAV